MPVGVVINGRFGEGTSEHIGVLTGHAAGLGVLKSLSTNVPDEYDINAGWGLALENFIVNWAQNLGYDIVDGNDVVDLAEAVWDGWDFDSIESASDVLEEKILEGLNLDEFGSNGINSTGIMNSSSTLLKNGVGKTELLSAGGDYIVSKLDMRSEMDLRMAGGGLFDTDSLDFTLTRDNQFSFKGKDLSVGMGGPFAPDVNSEVDLLVGVTGPDLGLNGSVSASDFDLNGVNVHYLGALFGAGETQGQKFFYLGGGVDGDWVGFEVGGGVLFGTLDPSVDAIQKTGRKLGLGDLLDKFQTQPDRPPRQLYTGAYLAVSGDFPIVDSGCPLEITIGGEMRA
jgi:hypothetical protein